MNYLGNTYLINIPTFEAFILYPWIKYIVRVRVRDANDANRQILNV